MSRRARAAALLLGLSGCVSLPPESLPIAHNPSGDLTRTFEDLGPAGGSYASPRFLVKAYGPGRAKGLAAMAEEDYERLMAHTGLFSFKPGGLYPIFVYKDADEFHRKTSAPSWSGGIAVGNAIYTYEGPTLMRTLAHEIAHLIFHDYMGGPGRLRWFNEGLAVYEELQASYPKDKEEIEDWLASSHRDPMAFADLVSYSPGGRLTRQWYGQSASLARYLVEVGGRTGVEGFLQASKAGAGLDSALAQGFPTLCDGLASLEKRWLWIKN
ncbi:MAG: hypothetical protein AAB412_01170 [Elusimicrobiota bacterium]